MVLSTHSTSFTFHFLLYCHTILSWSLCRILSISSTVACPTLSLFLAPFSVRSRYLLVLLLNFILILSRLLYLTTHLFAFFPLPSLFSYSTFYWQPSSSSLSSPNSSPSLPLESFSFLLSLSLAFFMLLITFSNLSTLSSLLYCFF